MTDAMGRADRIKNQCIISLNPSALKILDESHLHAGHREVGPGGETHFYLEIQSPLFKGKTTLAQHRLVMDLLKEEFAKGLHALRLKTYA